MRYCLVALALAIGMLAGTSLDVPLAQQVTAESTTTKSIGTFGGGIVEFQVDYDSSNRITALRCINNSDSDVWGEVTREDSGRSYSKTFSAHTNTYLPIPTSPAEKIQFDGFGPHQNFIGLRFLLKG